MIGLTIIFLIFLYVYITYKTIRFVATKTDKKQYWIVILLFFIILPTWDVILGKIYFNHLCKTEGGLKIYQSVQADGFLDTTAITMYLNSKVYTRDIKNAKKILDYGFKFYEIPTYQGIILHFSKDNDGNVVYEALEEPKSLYKYEYLHHKKNSYILGVHSNTQSIKDKHNNEIVKNVSFYRMGWLSKLMNNYLGGIKSESCFEIYSFTYQNDFKQKLLKGDFHE